MRPTSIIKFERIYWAIIALGVVVTALTWNDVMATGQMQRTIAQIGPAYAYIIVAVGLVIQLALWLFVARRGSVVAKWIFVVLSGFGILSSVYSLATHGAASPIIGVIEVTVLVLQGVAIWLLFQPDTQPWFGETMA